MIDVVNEMPHLFLGSRLKRLAEQMQNDAVLVAERAGIPILPGQYPLLATLDANGPTTIGDLAKGMRMSQPAITKNAGRLADAGLVAIERNDVDKRQRTVSLTPVGQDALDRSKRMVWPLVEAAVRDITEGLSGDLFDQIAAIEVRLAARSLSEKAQAVTVDLHPAADTDVAAIVTLMNRAYRSTGTEAGWNSEAGYMEGDRTNEALLREEIAAQLDATLLIWRTADDVRGCVWLEPRGDNAWYLGSLTVDPRRQNAGLGRQLLAASESWVSRRGGREITMTVVNVRDNLLAWYERRGYRPTGETQPFPYGDARFGNPKRDDLHFVVLRKQLR
jgi:DNA-binding MarR family transcriptional regulator/ribosomal protein S18 acetylase RimI-like enzyme